MFVIQSAFSIKKKEISKVCKRLRSERFCIPDKCCTQFPGACLSCLEASRKTWGQERMPSQKEKGEKYNNKGEIKGRIWRKWYWTTKIIKNSLLMARRKQAGQWAQQVNNLSVCADIVIFAGTIVQVAYIMTKRDHFALFGSFKSWARSFWRKNLAIQADVIFIWN
jgi:hypothetical protein